MSRWFEIELERSGAGARRTGEHLLNEMTANQARLFGASLFAAKRPLHGHGKATQQNVPMGSFNVLDSFLLLSNIYKLLSNIYK